MVQTDRNKIPLRVSKIKMSNKLPPGRISKQRYRKQSKKRVDTDARGAFEDKEEWKKLCHLVTTLMET